MDSPIDLGDGKIDPVPIPPPVGGGPGSVPGSPGIPTISPRPPGTIPSGDPTGKPVEIEGIDVLDVPDDVESYEWTVTRRGGGFRFKETFAVKREDFRGVSRPSVETEVTLQLPTPGHYDITIRQRQYSGGIRFERNETFDLKDFLVVSLGDSYASGQGNPDIPGRPEHEEDKWYDILTLSAAYVVTVVLGGGLLAPVAYKLSQDALENMLDWLKQEFTTISRKYDFHIDMDPEPLWLEKEAYRSLKSGSALAASELEVPEEGRLVTFLSFARSGATVDNGLLGPRQSDGKSIDAWIDHKGQIDEMEETLRAAGRNEIDALVISIGGNDLGFSSHLTKLVAGDWPAFMGGEGDSQVNREKTREKIDRMLNGGELERAFGRLKQRLDDANLDIKQVYLTEYPGTMFDQHNGEAGEGCGIFSSNFDLNVTQADAQLTRQAASKLNDKLRDLAARFHWIYIGGIDANFSGQGYCLENDSFYRSAEGSMILQGDTEGTMHPNEQGQAVYAKRIANALQTNMLGAQPGSPAEEADLEVGAVRDIRERWETVHFDTQFSELPVVLASIQTFHGIDTSAVRIRNLTEKGFEVRIEEKRRDLPHLSAETVGYAAFEPGIIRQHRQREVIGQAGFVQTNQPSSDHWHQIDIDDRLTGEVVVLMQVLSANGPTPVHIRLKDVAARSDGASSRSFFFKLEEWPSADGSHFEETIGYAVLKVGSHPVSGNRSLIAGTLNDVTHEWKENVHFAAGIEQRPVMLTQCQSFKGADPVVTRQKDIRLSEFSLRLQEVPSSNPHTQEAVGYVAAKSPQLRHLNDINFGT